MGRRVLGYRFFRLNPNPPQPPSPSFPHQSVYAGLIKYMYMHNTGAHENLVTDLLLNLRVKLTENNLRSMHRQCMHI